MNNKNQCKEPWFAVNLSLIFGGIGQLYAEKKVKGCIIIIIQLLLIGVGVGMFFYSNTSIKQIMVLGLIYLIISIWNLFDAYKSVSQNNNSSFEKERKGLKDYWLAVFLSVFFSLFVVYHTYKISEIREEKNNKLIKILLVIYLIVQLVPLFVIMNVTQSFVINGNSMNPILKSGDKILINKFDKKIKRGE
jgi:TM2 domain-containing membrane protein YozV